MEGGRWELEGGGVSWKVRWKVERRSGGVSGDGGRCGDGQSII